MLSAFNSQTETPVPGLTRDLANPSIEAPDQVRGGVLA